MLRIDCCEGGTAEFCAAANHAGENIPTSTTKRVRTFCELHIVKCSVWPPAMTRDCHCFEMPVASVSAIFSLRVRETSSDVQVVPIEQEPPHFSKGIIVRHPLALTCDAAIDR